MSCGSVFTYVDAAYLILYQNTISFNGAITLPGYTTPGTSGCHTYWHPAHSSCDSNTCVGCACGWSRCNCCWTVCNGWTWVSGYTTQGSCWSNPGTQLWPTTNIGVSASIPIEVEAGAGFMMTQDTPPTPFEAASVVINGFDIVLSLDGNSTTLNIPCRVTLKETNGSFSADVALYSLTSSIDDSGITFTLDMDVSLLFCLTPVNGAGWVNLVLATTYSVDFFGIGNITLSDSVLMPLISVDG